MEVYHASKTPLTLGIILEHRFIKQEFPYQFQAVESALNEPPDMRAAILKALLLADMVQNRGRSYLAFAVKETILEHVRVTEFPERISRYKAVFTSPNKIDAQTFREIVRAAGDNRPYLYSCILDGEFFTADLQYVNSPNPLAPMLKQVEYVMERSRFYWDGKHSESPVLECLAQPGTTTVVASVTW